MSGRSSFNRGKQRSGHGQRRGGGGFDSGGGRSGYSNRHSNEPPPRFKRNGDARGSGSSDGRGGYDHYEADHGRGSGSYSPHKGRQQSSNSSPRSNFGEYTFNNKSGLSLSRGYYEKGLAPSVCGL